MEQPAFNNLPAKYLSRGRTKVEGIVLHDTAGSGTHNDTRYLSNPGDGRKVSVDFTVERDGSIWKLNPDLDNAYCSHAGRNTRFKGYFDGAVNRVCIGIEIVQKAALNLTPTYTIEQVKAVAQLCAWLTEKYKLQTSDITTHRNIITDGSRSDPRKFPFDGADGFWQFYWEFKGKGAAHVTATVMQKTPVAATDYKVVSGDSLYRIAQRHNTTIDAIAALNPGAANLIVPGQVLKMPS